MGPIGLSNEALTAKGSSVEWKPLGQTFMVCKIARYFIILPDIIISLPLTERAGEFFQAFSQIKDARCHHMSGPLLLL